MDWKLNGIYKFTGFREDTVRVLYIFSDRVAVISVTKKDSLPYLVEKELINEKNIEEEADLYQGKLIKSPTESQEKAGKYNWELIKDLVQDEPGCFDRKIRSRYISQKNKDTGVSRMQIQRLLNKYWAGGKTVFSLYPDYSKRGGPGKERVTDKKLGRPVKTPTDNNRFTIGKKEKDEIERIIRKYYNRDDKRHTYHDCYKKFIKIYYTNAEDGRIVDSYPTETQFRYHAMKFVDSRKRAGSVIYNKDMRGITGSSRSEVYGPGDTYQIDATIADIYLVSRDDRNAVIGRPILYFVLDMFSHMITGFYCCLEYASWETARMALINSFANKVELCSRYGRKIEQAEWPCEGLPRNLIVDNGELISKASDAIIRNLGINVKNAAAWRPDMKGIVESSFRLLNMDVKSDLPGSVYPDFSTRTGRDYRLDAKLTLDEFINVIIIHILGYNKRLMQTEPQLDPDVRGARIPAIPIELWKWGIGHRTPALRKLDEEDLKVALCIQDTATVTSRGIKFRNLFYECDTAKVERWFETARTDNSWKISIAYDPSDMQKIYYLKDSAGYEVCTQTEDSSRQYPGLSLQEIEWNVYQRELQRGGLSKPNLQNELDTEAEIEKIINNAVRKQKPTSVKKVNTGQIRQNRKNEMMKRRQEVPDSRTLEKEEEPSGRGKDTMLKAYSNYEMLASIYLEEDEP